MLELFDLEEEKVSWSWSFQTLFTVATAAPFYPVHLPGGLATMQKLDPLGQNRCSTCSRSFRLIADQIRDGSA